MAVQDDLEDGLVYKCTELSRQPLSTHSHIFTLSLTLFHTPLTPSLALRTGRVLSYGVEVTAILAILCLQPFFTHIPTPSHSFPHSRAFPHCHLPSGLARCCFMASR